MNTNYFINLVAGNIFNTKKEPAVPAKYYVGLSSTDPTETGQTVTEPTGGAYARVELTDLSVPTDGVITNNSDILFPESTADWGTMTHYVVYDSPTEGNLLMHGQLPKQRVADSSTIVIIKAGNLSLSVI